MNISNHRNLFRAYLYAYLGYLSRRYRTDVPALHISFRMDKLWQAYSQRYGGKVDGFYLHEDVPPLSSGVYILADNLDLDRLLYRLRHEWRHHWQYTYHNCLYLWWYQHEKEYKRLYATALCSTEMDARNFGHGLDRKDGWHKSFRDEQLLAAFSEDELSRRKTLYEERILQQRGSEICNADNDNTSY